MVETDDSKQKMIKRLFSVGAHYGYTRSRRHPSMGPFIFGAKNRVEIFDLERVTELLEKAKTYMYALGQEKKQVLFVSSKHEARGIIKNAAEAIDMPYVSGRWIGGTFTNFGEIKKRIERLVELREQREKGTLEKYTKRERLDFDREIEDLEQHFIGLVSMKELPKAFITIDTKHEHVAVKEAQNKGIPIVGVINSDCNLKDTTYPIAANDTSLSSISFFINELVEAYKDGLAHPKVEAEAPMKEEEKTKAA